MQSIIYIEWINNKVLLYSTGNSIEYPLINQTGKVYEKEYIDIYVYVNHFAEQQKLIQYYESTILQ